MGMGKEPIVYHFHSWNWDLFTYIDPKSGQVALARTPDEGKALASQGYVIKSVFLGKK